MGSFIGHSSPGIRSPRVHVGVKTVCFAMATAVASVSLLTGCSGQPSAHQNVTGLLVDGGTAFLPVVPYPFPLEQAPRPNAPVPGAVVARNAAGKQFAAATGADGQFLLSLPPGTYQLTGNSLMSGEEPCHGPTLHVTRQLVRDLRVVCPAF
jgi:hypothetical protein